MKKIGLFLLGLAGAICLSVGLSVINNTPVEASANTVEPTVSLSETKVKVSNNGDKMLLVTAMKDYEDVYSVGYTFENYTVTADDKAETKTYYTSLTTGEEETAADIFGAEWSDAALIVWEVANNPNISFNAYALEGVRNDAGELTKPTDEIEATNTQRSNMKSLNISSKEDFLAIGNKTEVELKNIRYKLTTDLTFTTEDFTSITNSRISVNSRSDTAYLVENMGAHFDGQGYTITVTYENATSTTLSYPAVFDYITGTIENVWFNLDFKVQNEVSALARRNKGVIENCYIEATLNTTTGSYVGLPAYRQAVIQSSTGVVNKSIFIIRATAIGTKHSAALAVKFNRGAISNCSVVSGVTWSNHGQYISCDETGGYKEFQDYPKAGNCDANRTNCYLFATWADIWSTGDGYIYNADGTTSSGVYDVVELYSGDYWNQWRDANITYSVRFDTNSGLKTSGDYQIEVLKNGLITQPGVPEKIGYTFDGWYLDGTKYNFETPVVSDLTLTAKWTKRTNMTEIQISSKEDFLNIGKKADGTAYTAEELKNIRYKLTTDLTFTTEDFTSITNSRISVNSRSDTAYLVENMGAHFDGQGYTITVTYENATSTTLSYPAVFDYITGTIENVKFNLKFTANHEVAALARTLSGTVENCYIVATLNTIKYSYVGLPAYRQAVILQNDNGVFNKNVIQISGIVGRAAGATTGGTAHTAALVIKFNQGTISNCSVIHGSWMWGNHRQYISSDLAYMQLKEYQESPTLGNSDANRTNCYLFYAKADLKACYGHQYNADGTVADRASHKNLQEVYTGTYWDTWLWKA